MSAVDVLGWAGSALLIFSLLQARVLRFRVLNLIACVVLVVFNAIINVWPMVAMNVVLCGINLFFIRRLLRDRHDPTAYDVLEVGRSDAYLRHVLRQNGPDIAKFFPRFDIEAAREPSEAERLHSTAEVSYLVQHGAETVGVVLVRDAGDGVAQVELDYVTPRFRDFSPGEFVYRRSGLFLDKGFHRVVTSPGMVAPYYASLGFSPVSTPDGPAYALELPHV
jgi:hypothetical protein